MEPNWNLKRSHLLIATQDGVVPAQSPRSPFSVPPAPEVEKKLILGTLQLVVRLLQQETNPKKIPWCAFFADTDHEIHEVTAGVRVTLAYLLRYKDWASASPLIPRTLGDTEQTAALVMALRGNGSRRSFGG